MVVLSNISAKQYSKFDFVFFCLVIFTLLTSILLLFKSKERVGIFKFEGYELERHMLIHKFFLVTTNSRKHNLLRQRTDAGPCK